MSPKKFFRPFGTQFGGKIRGARAPRALPLHPPLLSLSSQRCVGQGSISGHWHEFCQVLFQLVLGRSLIIILTFVLLSAVQKIKKFIYKIPTLNFLHQVYNRS